VSLLACRSHAVGLMAVIGKASMDTMCGYGTKEGYKGSDLGEVKSAFETSLGPGGSSNGSAVGITAGFCTASFGSDVNGSLVSLQIA
jgi:amidase